MTVRESFHHIYCVCVKRIRLCNCLCSSSSPSSSSSRFPFRLIRNIEEFGEKKYFTDHQTANKVQLFIPMIRKYFVSILFQNKSQRRGFPQRLLDKYNYLLILISLKKTLRSGQKHVFTVRILISEQIAFAAVLYFRQGFVFCSLIDKTCWSGSY